MLENIKNARKCEKCRTKQCGTEISVKNQIDMLIFTQILVAQTSPIYYRREESEILLAIPPTSTSAEWSLV